MRVGWRTGARINYQDFVSVRSRTFIVPDLKPRARNQTLSTVWRRTGEHRRATCREKENFNIFDLFIDQTLPALMTAFMDEIVDSLEGAMQMLGSDEFLHPSETIHSSWGRPSFVRTSVLRVGCVMTADQFPRRFIWLWSEWDYHLSIFPKTSDAVSILWLTRNWKS